MSPQDYVISENLHRRHLNTAQLTEIGLILEKIEAKKAKERQSEMAKALAEVSKGVSRTKGEELNKSKILELQRKREEIKEKFGEGRSMEIAAEKVKVSRETLRKAKKIKSVAYDEEGKIKDKSIAEQWEDAKRGKGSVESVYKEVQEKEIIEELE